jgi:mannose/fructose-specific phosphotransferase system component IIA
MVEVITGVNLPMVLAIAQNGMGAPEFPGKKAQRQPKWVFPWRKSLK